MTIQQLEAKRDAIFALVPSVFKRGYHTYNSHEKRLISKYDAVVDALKSRLPEITYDPSGYATRGQRPLKSHCRNGHEFTEANTFTGIKGNRVCRKCRSIRDNKRKQLKGGVTNGSR